MWDAELAPNVGSEQAGRRPVLVISRDSINKFSPVVIAIPFTSYFPGRRLYPTQVIVLSPEGGLTTDSLAMCEQIRAISVERLRHMRGELSENSMRKIEDALLIAVDIPFEP